ncbi:EAL domain-containing protein [Aestuariibacter sp. A3R04]|uniref:sensor domain-containing phosphodiesterase n=1 Tax=Aestuariibacter sp. A3R04 TaxID=2841571 RepID=UPI001C084D02|nr:EAL domain-containing protein [Aestuariibacter sp. A3R04]MBU3021651.1 EAL domain-containing protein [Aestuariibacter sp. A3R04]
MSNPAGSKDEYDRIKALHKLNILDSEPEERFDRITRLAQHFFNCEYAAITFIDSERQWLKSRVNLALRESPKCDSFCVHTIAQEEHLVIADTRLDNRFANNPFVTGQPNIRFYAGVKLTLNGYALGALCVFDSHKKTFTDEQLAQLKDLANIVESELVRQEIIQANETLRGYEKQVEETRKLTRVRSAILEKIVSSDTLGTVLHNIVDAVEHEYSNMFCSILLLEGNRLRLGAAPSLPQFYNDAIDGVVVGPGVGSCGNTAYSNALTIVEDITTHPYWEAWSDIAAQAKLGSCWSQPIRGASGEALGTFAIYHSTPSSPTSEQINQIEQFAHIASIAIERERANQLIWRQANFDVLTGLPNRNLMEDHLNLALKAAQREKTKVAVLFLDLDNFKDVNDSLGHDTGDVLLVECAQRIENALRKEDTVSRLGGDEFVVVLGGLSDVILLEKVVQKLMRNVSEPYTLNQQIVHTSTSVGITLYPDDGEDITSLLKNADQAMYGAKAQGKNSYQFYTKSMQDAAMKRIVLLNDIREALKNEQFFLEYQPIVHLRTNTVTKAEALIRWQHPEKGLIRPDEFIPLAEESGLIFDISNWVFEQVCDDAIQWRRDLCPTLQLSINTSPSHYFSANPDIMDWLTVLLGKGLSSDAVLLEITENLFMEANFSVAKKLFQFRQAGVGIALDDFGTGYSSISFLKKYPTDFIKIDRSFVKSMTEVSNDKVLCEAIIVMAKKLGIKVVAEGIETEEQLTILNNMGCDYGQGYFLSKPLNKSNFGEILQKEQTK